MQSIDDLIIKYLNDTLSAQESKKLSEWVKLSDENLRYFNEFITHEYLLLHTVIDQENLQIPSFTTGSKRKKAMYRWAGIAALFLGVIAIASVTFLQQPTDGITQTPMFKLNKVIIQLEDGSTTPINQLETLTKIIDDHIAVDAQKEQIEYQFNQHPNKDQLVFHKIFVPVGRKYKVKLSDGTLVHLNAASTFRYPKQFSTKGPRNVYLEGEAYFEVSHDSTNPFIVNTLPLKIKVLGTKFNHSSYPNDSLSKTTLADGKVAIWKTKDSMHSYILKPMEAAIYNRNKNSLIKKTTNVDLDLAWIKNRLLFKAEPFSEISKRIERCYGVQITNKFDALNTVKFSGEFDLNEESIIEVLNTFQLSKPFKYHITDNEIIITKKPAI